MCRRQWEAAACAGGVRLRVCGNQRGRRRRAAAGCNGAAARMGKGQSGRAGCCCHEAAAGGVGLRGEGARNIKSGHGINSKAGEDTGRGGRKRAAQRRAARRGRAVRDRAVAGWPQACRGGRLPSGMAAHAWARAKSARVHAGESHHDASCRAPAMQPWHTPKWAYAAAEQQLRTNRAQLLASGVPDARLAARQLPSAGKAPPHPPHTWLACWYRST